MGFGIQNASNVTIQNITDIVTITSGDPAEFLVRINTIAFNGLFFFITLWVLGIILYLIAQEFKDQPLANATSIFTILAIIAFFLRAINFTINGETWYLINDFQLWVFPTLSVLFAGIMYFTRDV